MEEPSEDEEEDEEEDVENSVVGEEDVEDILTNAGSCVRCRFSEQFRVPVGPLNVLSTA